MPEISAAELRRLEALSDRIVRVDERRRTMAEERDAARRDVKQLRANVREMTARANEQAKSIDQLEQKIADLVAANAEQAKRLVVAERSARQAGLAAAKLADARDNLKEELVADRVKLKEATKQVGALQKQTRTLNKQVKLLEDEVAASDLPVFLPAEKVGELLDDFVTQFDVGGLRITDGDVRLTVAFADTGKGAAFVIPSSAAEKSELPLHTVSLKLGPRPPLFEEDPGR
jgi:DNA repair exonuclease SbcCD ATPase subunit